MITLEDSINIHDYKPVLEGLINDFGYTYYHAIIMWCEIVDGKHGYDNKYWQVRLIKLNGKVIGICGLYSMVDDDKSDMWLGWFGIVPEFRNNGYGETVLTEMEEMAKKDGCKTLYSYVDKSGKPLPFYFRNGFERISTVDEYLKNNNMEYNADEFESLEDHVIRKNLIP